VKEPPLYLSRNSTDDGTFPLEEMDTGTRSKFVMAKCPRIYLPA
jgi:hypothetical protein